MHCDKVASQFRPLFPHAGTEDREDQGADREPSADQHAHDVVTAGRRVSARQDDPAG